LERREIEAFLTLAEELHFGRTAERLRLTSARISQTIQKVEHRIGTALFERSTHQVSLTSIGRQLRDDLIPHYRGIQEAEAKAISAGRAVKGVLSVGFCSPLVGVFLAGALDVFRGLHPDCEVQMREIEPTDPYGPLRRGEVDVQVSEFPVDEPGLTAGPVLLVNPLVLAVASDHPIARQESAGVDDLARDTLAWLPGVQDYVYDQLIPAYSPSGRPIRRGPVAASWHELLTLVSTGKCIAVAGAQESQYRTRPDITYIPLHDASPISYGFAWRSAHEISRIRAFVQVAREFGGIFKRPHQLPAGAAARTQHAQALSGQAAERRRPRGDRHDEGGGWPGDRWAGTG
jgi:DNA-binding transcriptional LysR family regulator